MLWIRRFFVIFLCFMVLEISYAEEQEPVSGLDSSGPPLVDVNIFARLAHRLVPSVVSISSYAIVKSPLLQGDPNDVLRRFFGEMFRQYGGGFGGDFNEAEGYRQRRSRLPRSIALGTGFIIDSSGLVLTNHHVIAGADEIKITFTESPDEKPSDAEVVGRDPDIDIALIRVKTKRKIVPAILGNSDQLKVGEYVMTVGNPMGHGHSVTHGIISAVGRRAPDFPLASYLQTDAPINPGNSGGPLVNLKGEVIGINNAIDQRAQGIGFAIPINLVKTILPQLLNKGAVSRGFIGVWMDTLSSDIAMQLQLPKKTQGALVTYLAPGEPAHKAGVQPYDVIVEFNHQPIRTANDLIKAVMSAKIANAVPMKIMRRGGRTHELSIIVGEKQAQHSSLKKEMQHQPIDRHLQQNSVIDVGMKLQDLTDEVTQQLEMSEKPTGVIVLSVQEDGAADHAGLVRGDVILQVSNKKVENVSDFYASIREKRSYLLQVRRKDEQGRSVFSVIVLDLTK